MATGNPLFPWVFQWFSHGFPTLGAWHKGSATQRSPQCHRPLSGARSRWKSGLTNVCVSLRRVKASRVILNIYIYTYTGWVFQPLWKILVRLDHHPSYWGQKTMFQTTNQYIHICIYICMAISSMTYRSVYGDLSTAVFFYGNQLHGLP